LGFRVYRRHGRTKAIVDIHHCDAHLQGSGFKVMGSGCGSFEFVVQILCSVEFGVWV